MIVGSHKGRVGHTWRLHHHCREHPALLKPASLFHDGLPHRSDWKLNWLPRLELGSWRGIPKVELMWSLRCKASYSCRTRTGQCTQEIKCVECAWTQSKRVVFNPWNSCHCNRHGRHHKLCLFDTRKNDAHTRRKWSLNLVFSGIPSMSYSIWVKLVQILRFTWAFQTHWDQETNRRNPTLCKGSSEFS